MPIDWETARRNRVSDAPPPGSDWAERERLAVEKLRGEMAHERQRELHQAAVKAYAAFASGKADRAKKGGDAGAAKVWTTAADNIGKGVWTVARIISSDPEVVRFQGLRTAFCYEGKTAQL